MSKRLTHAYSISGENIKYASRDCGLGSWPTQEIAAQLLRNVAQGMSDFRKGL